ncbi:MAG: hypothetical protein IT353_22645 [Gemmatimonadaceae bacterium]|nr:hypothetical protein [Gemmatimonadaceae bacterium]
MRSLPRQIASAILLSLQLVLATRGFLWYPSASSTAGQMAAGHAMAAMPEGCVASAAASAKHAMASAHNHGHAFAAPAQSDGAPSDANMGMPPCSDDEPPCHDGVGCHAGTPCCAPGLLVASYVTPSARIAADAGAPALRNAGTLFVAARIAHRLPLSTAPPAV